MKTPVLAKAVPSRRSRRLKVYPDAVVVVMVRYPQAGRVKTRLAREIGAVRAVSIYRNLTATTLTRMAQVSRVRVVLSVSPDTTCPATLPT